MIACLGFRMSPGLVERKIAAVVGALVADAAGMWFVWGWGCLGEGEERVLVMSYIQVIFMLFFVIC